MSSWDSDFRNDAPRTIKVPHDQLGATRDRRGELLARVSSHLPDPEEPNPNVREVLSVEDAAIRVAAERGSPTLANSQAFKGTEAERRERVAAMQSVQAGATVTTGEAKPKPTSRRQRQPTPPRSELDEEIARHEREEAQVDAWLASLENEGAEVNEDDIPVMSDDAYNAWLAANHPAQDAA